MENKNLNVTVSEGDAFFSHEMSINFNPTQFVFDFKCVTPRIDIRSKDKPSINIKHDVVMVDPYHAKRIHDLLGKVIGDYEKEFGPIIKPESIERMEAKASKMKKTAAGSKKSMPIPTYFG